MTVTSTISSANTAICHVRMRRARLLQ